MKSHTTRMILMLLSGVGAILAFSLSLSSIYLYALTPSSKFSTNDGIVEAAVPVFNQPHHEIANKQVIASPLFQNVSSSSSRLCITTHSDPSRTDTANDIVQTSDGGWIMTGATGSYDDSDIYNDIWIIRFLPDCSVKWQKVLDTSGNHFNGWQIINSSDNNYLIYVSTGSYSTKFIFKISDAGEVLWQKAYKAGVDFDLLFAIAEKSDGGAILVGRKDKNQEFIVLSINSDGEPLWQKVYSSPNSVSPKKINTLSDSTFLVTGVTAIQNTDYLYAMKLDSFGEIIWQYTFGATEYWQLRNVSAAEGGSSIIVAVKAIVPSGRIGSYVLRLNGDGTIRWEKFYYHQQDGLGIVDIHQTQDSGPVGVGYYAQADDEDVWIVEIDDQSGNLLWQKRYPLSGGDDNANAVNVMPDSSLLIAGNTRPGSEYNAFVMHVSNTGTVEGCSLPVDTSAIVTDTSTVPTATSFSAVTDEGLAAFATSFPLQNSSADFGVICGSDVTPPRVITDLGASTGHNHGEVDLTWTAPGDDIDIGTPATYIVRYAYSPIATELAWQSATDIANEPLPHLAGTSENMVVLGLTPGQSYYFAIRAEDEAGNISDLSNSPNATAKEGADLGFRPNPDGYQFANPGFMQPTCLDFQNTYSGLDIQCANNQPQEEYRTLYFNDYLKTFSTGICTGMATSSLLYYTGAEPRPQPGTTFDLDLNQARSNIAIYHGRQHSRAVLDIVLPSWNNWTENPSIISQRVDEVYGQIKASLSSENSNPLILDLFPRPRCGTSGHTVVPYRLDDADPLHPKVYVYENYYPDNTDKYIQFDLSTSTHSFSYWLWGSAFCGALVAIPVDTFTNSAGNIPGRQAYVRAEGNIEPLLTNSTGNMVGYDNGELTATIAGAMPVFPWYTPNVTPTVTSFLMPPDLYTTTLSSSGGGYTFTVWSSSGSLELRGSGNGAPFTNNLQLTSNDDHISFDADLHSVTLFTSSEQGQSVTLKMSIPDTNDSQVYTLDNVDLFIGSDLTVNVSDSALELTSRELATDYDINFSRVSTQTLSVFVHANLTLLANDKHFLTFSDSDDALLQIDHGGDGSIDDTTVLNNQVDALKVYLPTILR